MQSADQRRALADRFTLVFLKDPRPFSPQWWERRTRRSLSLFDRGASAFMFELADAKQEYSKMLNCSTKDWPAEQPCHCGAPSPCTMPWLSQNGQRFSLQKAGSCVLKKKKKGCNWSYLVKLEPRETLGRTSCLMKAQGKPYLMHWRPN